MGTSIDDINYSSHRQLSWTWFYELQILVNSFDCGEMKRNHL